MMVDLNRVSSYLMREKELNESRERERQKVVLCSGKFEPEEKSWAWRNRLTKAKRPR